MKNFNFGCLVLDKTKASQDNALLVISTVLMDLTLSERCTNDIVWIKAIRSSHTVENPRTTVFHEAFQNVSPKSYDKY